MSQNQDTEVTVRYVKQLEAINAELVALLKDTRLHLDIIMSNTDSYCEFCKRHAPKDDAGMITGRIHHREECFIGAMDAMLAKLEAK